MFFLSFGLSSAQNDQNFQKMEKAEILELTVNFLKMIREQQITGQYSIWEVFDRCIQFFVQAAKHVTLICFIGSVV